jgi:hypothetical protein
MFIDHGDGPQLVDIDIDTEHRTGQASKSDQSWFWTPEWQAGEREASDDIAAGRVNRYPSAEDFLASIGFGPLKPEEAKIAVQAAIHAVEAHRFAEYAGTGEPVPRPDPEVLKARNAAVDDLIQGLLDDGEEY